MRAFIKKSMRSGCFNSKLCPLKDYNNSCIVHEYNLPVAILALSVKGPTTIKLALTGGLPITSFPNNSPIVSSTYSKQN